MPVLSVTGAIAVTLDVIAPTLTVGDCTVVPEVIDVLARLYVPTVSTDIVTLTPDVISVTVATEDPGITLRSELVPDVITVQTSVTAPTISVGSVVYDLDKRGRRQIVVDQQQGGSKYPFVNPSDDLDQLIGDIWFSYADNSCEYTPPLKIKWLRGFGTIAATDPVGVVNQYDVEITDEDGTTIFNTTDATNFRMTDWGDGTDNYMRVLEWVNDITRSVLRMTIYTSWIAETEARDWPVYFEPTSAVIDSRATYRLPPVVTSLAVANDYDNEFLDDIVPADKNLVLDEGYNTELLVNDANDLVETVDGASNVTTIRIDLAPGLGLGRFDCTAEKYLTKINGVGPDDNGNILLDTTDCYRFERPLLTVDGVNATVQKATLKISNDCGPCCECADFVNVYEAIRVLTNKYKELGIRAEAVRDQYLANSERWQAGALCRADSNIQTIAESFPGGKVAIGVGVCNTTDTPMLDVTLTVSFDYGPDSDGISANSSVVGCVTCNSTTRKGNTVPGSNRSAYTSAYKLEGTWPEFTMHFDCINPGTLGTVSWVMWFDGATDSDVVEFVVSGGKKVVKRQVTIVDTPETDCCEPSTTSSTAP